ncbi:AAA domain-containing protein [uncultured Polaribacter sp.]|uniref:AAA domain-containing protein n=1 Tax=uncultured Polaribacter sp. TaxID=174711 RepID=UPI00262D6527|nr:AAA domain-containing protein [uncultured Polaribacter sp.]
MKIKDIREFRTFFKTKVRETLDTNRDEHFIGTNHYDSEIEKNVFGFFDLYHGQKSKGIVDGIKGFLKGFLDMAQDAQAVYEFLQNAVDANSSHFLMIWGEDETEVDEEGKPCEYLIVLNNGWQFNFDGIESILNVGVSTKTEEEHTIGKFGIGFKLAHRLVGKENGLDELLDKNYGPLLFSWSNGELKTLMEENGTEIIPVSQEYKSYRNGKEQSFSIESTDPWLFKILITNFPTQPDELIRDAYYKERNDAFSSEDVKNLSHWLTNYRDVIPFEDYEEGSLFFLKLGAGKSKVLSNDNLKEGIRFSLSILNQVADSNVRGLKKVHLNGDDIVNAPLKFESFVIEKDSEEYTYIRFGKSGTLSESEQKIIASDSNIQFLFGYTEYEKALELINNVPNFYLYFPLSEEKHKLRFILHSNAFYKKSARTSLHSDAINERLLETFSKLLIESCIKFSSSDDKSEREKFLEIYPILLLSHLSEDQDRVWINEPLVNNIHNYLKSNIPVVSNSEFGFDIVNDSQNIRIKATNIDIKPETFGLDIKWFFWGNNTLLKDSTDNNLGLKEFSILDLLYIEKAFVKINTLLKSNSEVRNTILEEINLHIPFVTGSSSITEIFKDNFHELELFEFDNGDIKSINQLKNLEGEIKYLLLFEEIENIKELLIKSGFICTKFGLSKYSNISDFIRKRQSISYNDYKVLNEYLSSGFERTSFTNLEKHLICQTLEKAKDKESELERNQRMQVLRLFENQQGDIVALGSLLKEATKPWLKPFIISNQEHKEYLNRYLIGENEAYTKVVIPLWNKIIADKNGLIKQNIKSFFSDIINFQEITKQTQSLSNSIFIPIASQFSIPSDAIYYEPEWSSLSIDNYNRLTVVLKSYFKKDLPIQEALPFLKQAPFSLSNSKLENLSLETELEIEKEDIVVLAKATILAKIPLFEKFIIVKNDKTYIIRPKNEGEDIAWCAKVDLSVANHLKKYHKNLIIAPDITELKGLISLKDKELAEYFINEWIENDEVFNDSLSNIVVSQEDTVKIAYLNKCGHISVDLEDYKGYEKLKNSIKVSLTFLEISIPKEILHGSISIKIDTEKSFNLNDVISSISDSIYFGETNEYHLKLSQIFTADERSYSKHIEAIIEKLHVDYEFDKSKLGQLFNLKESENKQDILSRIDNSIQSSGYLANASQLCFVLLYKKYIDPEFNILNYSLKKGKSLINLDNQFAVSIKTFSLFKTEMYLDDVYEGVESLLKLTSTSPFLKVEGVSFYLQPVIENGTLLGPELKESMLVEEQLILLNYLLSQQKNSNEIIYKNTWEKVFGFNPAIFVSAKYSLAEKETLPKHINTWYWFEKNIETKKYKASLLSAVGFNLSWSKINTLREVLIDEKSTRTFSIPDIELISLELLENSLWKIKKEKPYYKFSRNDKNYDLLKAIVKKCIQNDVYNIPLPVNTLEVNKYDLAISSENDIYYYDNNTFHELSKLKIDLSDIIAIPKIKIYDATNWNESEKLKETLNKIEVKKEKDYEQIISTREEWSEKFYLNWKLKYPQISIYHYSGLPIKLSLEGNFIKEIIEDKYYLDKKVIHCPRKFSFSEITSLLKTTDWLTLESLNSLIESYETNQMKILELLSNPILDDDMRKIVDDKKNELEAIAHRKELTESLAINEYSYKWFLDFIEIQKLQDNESDSTTPEQEISFFRAEWEVDSKRLVILKDPNRSVTPTIEYCTDFTAIFIFNNSKSLEVKIQDISKKGQVVWAMISKSKELINANLKDLKRVDLKFSRSVNLLNRLYNAFKWMGNEKDWQDNYNLKDNLSHEINFIFGPPGTGKTTTIAERLINLMNKEPALKVLVLTPTNKAADVLTTKIITQVGDDNQWLVRYGATFSNDVIERNLLKDKASFIYDAYPKCVCISTIHRFPYEETTLSIEDKVPITSRISDMHWDYVVFDESSMIPLSYIMYVLHKSESQFENKKTRYWIGGDPFQIPPVINIINEDLPADFNKEANIYSLVGLKTFDINEQKLIPIYGECNRIENLTTQYRSIESIGGLYSKFTYNNSLKHFRANQTDSSKYSRPLPEKVEQLGIKPITLLKFPVNTEDSVYSASKLRKSPYHIYSAILLLEMIIHFDKSITVEEKEWTIGIVCPYRSQATLINKMIESLDLKHNLTVIIDTVHGFQGDECDIVYFIVNPPSNSISSPNYGAFVHKNFLINVAISRAKDYLVILYPDDKTQGINNLVKINKNNIDSIEDILKNKMNLKLEDITIHSSAVEEKLFKDFNFIEKNIITNKHQLVNVYNVAQKKYLVRESSTAIDIQIKS